MGNPAARYAVLIPPGPSGGAGRVILLGVSEGQARSMERKYDEMRPHIATCVVRLADSDGWEPFTTRGENPWFGAEYAAQEWEEPPGDLLQHRRTNPLGPEG